MAEAPRDENRVTSLLGTSSADGTTTLPVYVDAATNRLLVTGVGGGGTSAVDDSAFVAGSGAGTPAMGFATSDAVDAGDVGVLAMDVNRNLKVAVQSGGGGSEYDIQDVAGGTDTGSIALVQRNDVLADLSGGDGAYSILQVNATGALYIQEGVAMDVSGATVTVDNSGFAVQLEDGGGTALTSTLVGADQSLDVNLTQSVSLDVSAATVTVDATNLDIRDLTEASDGVEIYGSDDGGATQRVIKTDAGGAVQVDIESSVALDVSAATVTVDLGANNDVVAAGDVAHDSADSGNPLKIGGRAQDIIGAEPEEVADDDRVDALFDMNGRLAVTAGSDYKYADINDAASGNNTIIAAQAAGKRIAVWSILIVSDGTVDVRWEDGAGGTAFTGQVPLQEREGYTYSAGGLVPLFVGTAATLLNLELSAAINVHGHVSYTVLDD